MEIASISKTAYASASNAPQRTDVVATPGASRTVLPPESAVQAIGAADAVRVEVDPSANSRAAVERAMRDMIERRIDIDPATRMVVYQTIDRETGDVVRQVPDQALLRLRAYAREMRAKVERDQDWDQQRVERIA